MAPELVTDVKRVTEKVDVWSLGVVLWEMLTLQTPYADCTPQQILAGAGISSTSILLLQGSIMLQICTLLHF